MQVCQTTTGTATAAYLKNRTSTSALHGNTTPHQKWSERKPDVCHLRVFGCIAYAHIPNCDRQKLDTKAKKLRFVGYCKNSKGYRLFDEETRKILKRRDVTFDETVFVFNKPVTDKIVDVEPVIKPSEEETHQPQYDTQQPQDDIEQPQDGIEQPQDGTEERRRSQRARGPPVRFGVDEFVPTQQTI